MRSSAGSSLRNTEGLTISPIQMSSGDTGALLIHGYLATPEEMRGLAEHLAQHGITVYAPLVAGHGSSIANLLRTTWQDWYQSVEGALAELHEECAKVFVVGLSLGGLQALHLAAHHPELAGVIAMAPPVVLFFDERRPWRRKSDLKLWLISRLPWLARIYPGEPSDFTPQFLHADIRDEAARKRHIYYGFNPTKGVLEILNYQEHVKRELALIRQPLLLIHSPLDHTVPPKSSSFVFEKVSSTDNTLDFEVAASSWHVLTEDVDVPKVYERIGEFIQNHR